MNTKNVLLGIFVALTLVFASLTLEEYSRATRTQTLTSTTTATTTTTVTNLMNVTSSGASTSTVTSGESSSTISPAPCALSYRVPPSNVTTLANGTQITESAEPAFLVGTGSAMKLCIEFFDPAYTNRSVSTPTSLYAFSWPESPGLVGVQPANNVSTTATPENISLSAGQSTVVEYKISTGGNSTGFDGLQVNPVGALYCTAIPVAVGYQASQVNSSDFSSYYQGVTMCPPGSMVGLIIGYTGASIVYITEESRG